MRPLMTATGTPLCFAAHSMLGHNSPSARTSKVGRTRDKARRAAQVKSNGQSMTTFRGTPRSGLKTRGDLGTKDFQCTSADTKGQCAGTYDWLSAYFTSTDGFKSFHYVRYVFTYHATEGGKGTWTDRLVGGKYQSAGDIRPLKKK